MTLRLLGGDVWPELSKAARGSRAAARVAVAYFSAGASRLLPLRRGSRLVVDASRAAVSAGQTHPETLLQLVRRGVHVYSVANLHAKVFVVGKRAFIGSNNASRASADQLLEAAVVTTDSRIVEQARDFVDGLCQDPLSPEVLAKLQKVYRPPMVLGRRNGSVRVAGRSRPRVSPIRLAQLELGDWPDEEAPLQERGERLARSRREHRGRWEVQCFRITGKCAIQRSDTVVQVIAVGGGRRLVEPAGKVINVQQRATGRGRVAYVYVEVPVVARRISAKRLAARLGRGAMKRLLRDGRVRDAVFAHRLIRALER